MFTINKAMKILGSSGIYKKARYPLEVRKNKKFLNPCFHKNPEASWNFGILIRKAVILLI